MKILIFILLLPVCTFAQTAKKYLKLGDQKSDSAKYREAISCYSQAIVLDSTYVDAYIARVKAKGALKDYKGAIEDLDKVIILKPNYADAYMNRAHIKYILKDYNGVIDDCTKWISYQPTNANAYVSREMARENNKDYAGAIQDYSTAIIIGDDKKWSYYNNRGILKRKIKDTIGAMDDYTKSIELRPSTLAYMNRGIGKRNSGDLKGAIEDYTAALSYFSKTRNTLNDKTKSSIYQNIGEAELVEMDFDDAFNAYDEALSLDATSARAYCGRGDAKNHKGDKEGACADWNTALGLGFKAAGERINKFCK